nr:MAG TPA: Prex DNA polymerase [Caudoviricetes sp.]
MIYLVTKQTALFQSDNYKIISVEESLKLLDPLHFVGLDTETEGLDCHTKRLLLIQLGCENFQVVIDCSSIDPLLYKDYLESNRVFVGWNLGFDIKFLYKHNIWPNNLWDGMLAEILLYLGYPTGMHEMSLAAAADRYLGNKLDKSVRGKIITQGLTDEVVVYAAYDVKYLELIKIAQEKELEKQNLLTAIKFENAYLKCNAYIEFCGVKLDVDKWKQKMKGDLENLQKAEDALNAWVVEWEKNRKGHLEYIDTSKGRGKNVIDSDRKNMTLRKGIRRVEEDVNVNGVIYEAYELGKSKKFTMVDTQGDLWAGFNTSPKCTIKWSSPKQVIEFFEELGIDVWTIDKATKEKKKSVQENVISPQKDKFPIIPLYLNYKQAEILVGTFGEKFLKFINPATGRIHSNFKQLGCDTGRLSSNNPNQQNLPKDKFTRSCFVAEKGNKFISCDYSGQESFVMASLSNDSAMLDELLNGSGDLHSLTARMVFPEIPDDTPLSVVKTQYHDLRDKAKGYEFCFNYYGNDATLVRNYGIDPAWAKHVYTTYMSGYSGLYAYQQRQVASVMRNGYIVLNKLGHRAHIYDFADWPILKEHDKKRYNKRVAESKKQSVNYLIQGTGAAMFKLASIKFFNYLKQNKLLNVVKYCIPVHDNLIFVVFKLG